MAYPEFINPPLTKLCLFDFNLEDLQRILGNEDLSKELTQFGESSPLTHIDELTSLFENPPIEILLNKESAERERERWTVEIPESLAFAIKDFLRNPRG